mmetsp:Transcript_21743/g.37065  ORF Transcript_21743/g.37065 Transcript_21743/m.37065 type:complete len:87 (-) Transcript_21743:833-1093(-)
MVPVQSSCLQHGWCRCISCVPRAWALNILHGLMVAPGEEYGLNAPSGFPVLSPHLHCNQSANTWTVISPGVGKAAAQSCAGDHRHR